MTLLFHFLLTLFFLQNVSVQAEKTDAKLEKLTKVSDFKQKLSKEHASLEAKADSTTTPDYDKMAASDLGISVPPQFLNYTIEVSHHVYYNSTIHTDPEMGKKFWIDLSGTKNFVMNHAMLSNSYRQATTVDLKFGFPFYGSILNNVTIATGGFLYMGDYLHNWIAATQYVAPLMGNFDTSQSSGSQIKYYDNGTAFTVEWHNVGLQDRLDEGNFTFQVTLLKNGDIIFAYQDLPKTIAEISDDRHPVKVGISDAYILERSLYFVKRKTIYEYHKIDFLKKNISNNTAIYFTALPTCTGFKECSACLAADEDMGCSWCSAVKRCSDGIDRNRQSWIVNNCLANKATTCSAEEAATSTDSSHIVPRKGADTTGEATEITTGRTSKAMHKSSTYDVDTEKSRNSLDSTKESYSHFVQETYSSGMSVGAIVTLAVFLVVMIAAAAWMGYAYKFPQSSSGQFLIKYRPSQWAMRKEGNSMVASSRSF